MPVTDLREYLQLPQAAPQNPGFQRTRQLAGMPTEPFQSALAFERAAPGIRANQGLAYLQEIQNHQNEIAQQAQNIRIQQEAQLAAEQATQGLSGIQPDNPQYLNQRQQILQQNPNALLNPQFRNALGIYDEGYQRVAQQRALEAKQIQAQRQQAHALGLRAIEYGAPPDVVAEHVQTGNISALAQITGEARRAGLAKPKSGTEPADYRTKAAYGKYLDAVADGNTEAATEIDKFARQGGFHWETPVAQNVATPTAAPVPVAKTEPVQADIPVVEDVDLANVPYAQIGQVAAQKKAENEEIRRVNQAWNQAKNELESKLKTIVPDAPFAGTKVNQLERFAKAVMDDEVVNAEPGAPYVGQEFDDRIPVWQPILNNLKLSGEAFKNPDSAILSKTSVPYGDLIKAWAQSFLNDRGKLLPTKESPSGSTLTEQQIKDMNDLATLAKSK